MARKDAGHVTRVRHGQTIWNRERRLQGRGDSPLTSWGIELATASGELLRRELRGEREVAVYSSPMGRARHTANIVADLIGTGAEAVIEDELLAEHDVGSWGGLNWVEPVHVHGRSYRLSEGRICELIADAAAPPPEAALG